MGGGTTEAGIFSGNRGDLSTSKKSMSEQIDAGRGSLEGMIERNGAEQAPEMMAEQGEMQQMVEVEPTDPRLSNAIGIVTVGATGVTPEREAQMREQIATLPTDNRTAEEVAIGAPEVARDGDRMEKEWMDRAREVVKETKNDPNGRLLRVARLREDYMRKRFNRILGERNDV